MTDEIWSDGATGDFPSEDFTSLSNDQQDGEISTNELEKLYVISNGFLFLKKVFSRVVATFDGEFNVWLPPCDELSGFIEQLSGFEVEATEKNGELSICGTLEAVNSIEVTTWTK